jgi:hypothetical protein
MKRLAVLLPALLALQVGVQPALAWTWPVDGPVLQTFNLDANPYAGGQHRGIDVGAPVGTTVLAPAAGRVSFAGSVATNGRTVTIQTPDGLSVTLVQLGAIDVSKGANVSEGGPIGTVGPSSDAEIVEPHVHLGIRRTADPNGYLDPLAFLPTRSASETPPEPQPAPEPAPAPASRVGQPARLARPAKEPSAVKPTKAKSSSRTSAPRLSNPKLATIRVHAGERRGARPHAAIRPLRRGLRFIEPTPVPAAATAPAAGREGSGPIPILFALVTLVAALAAGLLLAVVRRQLPNADAADRPAPVLLERLVTTAEDADGLRLGEEDRLVFDRDLQRVLLAQAEALADLDGDHNPAELVYVADDPRPRHPSRNLRRCLDRLFGGHGLEARRAFRSGSPMNVPPRCAF